MKISQQSLGLFFFLLMFVLGSFLPIDFNDSQLSRKWSKTQKSDAINAVIGDESYVATYGHAPVSSTSEKKRITTHLQYVKQKLLQRDVSHLTKSQKQRRQKHLNRLETYIQRGEFPQNNAFANQHRPNFIDREGRICAVGYLIEQSMGREVAEKINGKYQYEYVLEMESQLLKNWAERNGFTLRELAMIQPAYCFSDGCARQSVIPDKIGRSTESILIGANVGFTVINGMLALEKSGNLVSSSAGVALGASTVALGLTNHSNYSTADYITGGIAMATSGWLLYSVLNKDKEPSKQNLTVAPVASPQYDGNVGLSLNYRF